MKKAVCLLVATVMLFSCAAFAEQELPKTTFMFAYSFTFGLWQDHFSNMDDMTIAGIDHAKMIVNGDESRIIKQCIYDLGAITEKEYDAVLQMMLEKYPAQGYSQETGLLIDAPAQCYGAYSSGTARAAEDAKLKCAKDQQWRYYHEDITGSEAEGPVLVDLSLLTDDNGRIKTATITYTLLPQEPVATATPVPANWGL